MRRAWTFIWKIFTQGCFLTSLVKNGSVVLEKKIFNSSQCTFTISQLSPLWEGCGPSFEQTWIPFTQGYFVPKLAQWFWRRRRKCVKFTDRRTDRRQVIRKAHLSFQLRWAKNTGVTLTWVYVSQNYSSSFHITLI